MTIGELVTRWTVRAAVALYFAALAIRASGCGGTARTRWARLLWTSGCLAFVAHVASAFHFYHHWSHMAAYQATAKDTARFFGLDWGGGLYFNYVFTLAWLADAGWWWRGLKQYEARPRVVEWAVQGFFVFMIVNATLVFGTGLIRWVAAFGYAILAAAPLYGWTRQKYRRDRLQ
jgi:hypothetical protein